MNYWQKRNASDLIMQEKKEIEFEKKLIQEYSQAKAKIEEQLKVFYTLYAHDNKISYSDAIKKLNANELNSFKKALERYKKSLSNYNNRTTESLMKSIEKDLNKVNVTRLESIQKQIGYEIEELKAKQEKRTSNLLRDGYEDTYYRTMFNNHQKIGVGYAFNVLNTKAIERAINAKFEGQDFSSRIWIEKDKLILNLNSVLAQNIARGSGLEGIIKDVMRITNATYYNASRLARSELNRVCGLANADSYKESDLVEEYEFVAILDSRTSDICAEMDGKRFSKNEYTPGVNAPPMHANCRSTTVAVIGSNAKERIAKNENGQYIKVDANMKYLDWAKQYCPQRYVEYVERNIKDYKHIQDIEKQTKQIDKTHQSNISQNKKN